MNNILYTTEIQPTMRRTVDLVQRLGFKTTDSGDGVLNVEAGMEGALSIAHVFAVAGAQNLVDRCDDLRISLQGRIKPGTTWSVEGLYSSEDAHAVVALYGVTDAQLVDLP